MSRYPSHADPSGLTPEQRPIYDAMIASRGRLQGPAHVLLNHPKLHARMGPFTDYIVSGSTLPDDLREFVTLLVTRFFGAQYGYTIHLARARKAGVPEAAIAAIRDRQPIPGLGDRERIAETMVHELLTTHALSDETYAEALQAFGLPSLIDLSMTIGCYAMLAQLMNTFQIEPAPGETPLPQ